MEVPAGFRQTSIHNQQLRHYHLLKHNTANQLPEFRSDEFTDLDLEELSSSLPILHPSAPSSDTSVQSAIPDICEEKIPIIRSVDKPSTSLLQVMSMTEDYL